MTGTLDGTAPLHYSPSQSQRTTLAVIYISGADAADFLHGQFSGDVRALRAGQSLLTAWCNPKGRVLFLPRLLRDGAGEFYALLAKDQAAGFVKRLRMFTLRAKVQIEDRCDNLGVLVSDGVVSSDDRALAHAINGERRWLVVPQHHIAALLQTHAVPLLDDNSALLADIRRGEPLLDGRLTEQFLPQELNLDILAGVSFNKGCYPGQEIVARVKFRGAVKRRVQRFCLAAPTPPTPGTRLLGSDQVAHGTVLAAASCADQQCEVLAVVDLDAGELHLAGADHAVLSGLPLPYASTGA